MNTIITNLDNGRNGNLDQGSRNKEGQDLRGIQGNYFLEPRDRIKGYQFRIEIFTWLAQIRIQELLRIRLQGKDRYPSRILFPAIIRISGLSRIKILKFSHGLLRSGIGYLSSRDKAARKGWISTSLEKSRILIPTIIRIRILG